MIEAVIKLPAKVFNKVMHGRFDIATDKDYTILMRAFNDCTILPTGHGDLIDRSKIIWKGKCCCRIEFCSGSCETCSDNCVEVMDIESAPTVIPADKESDNG